MILKLKVATKQGYDLYQTGGYAIYPIQVVQKEEVGQKN